MALDLINTFSVSDVNLTNVMQTLNKTYNIKCSLSEYTTTTVPAIEKGSKVEVADSIYEAAANEAISTTDPDTASTVADGLVYIRIIPAVGGATATAAFTATAPVWDGLKQGWYKTATNEKYLSYAMTKAGSSYSDKYEFPFIENTDIKFLPNGEIQCVELNVPVFGDITPVVLLTGTTVVGTITTMAYPSGYTQSNSMILASSILASGSSWSLPVDLPTAEYGHPLMTASDVRISHTSSWGSKPYKLLIAKIS